MTTLVAPSDAVWWLASGLMQRSGGVSIQAIQTPFTASFDQSPWIALYGACESLPRRVPGSVSTARRYSP